jgi:hypothetical protein
VTIKYRCHVEIRLLFRPKNYFVVSGNMGQIDRSKKFYFYFSIVIFNTVCDLCTIGQLTLHFSSDRGTLIMLQTAVSVLPRPYV